MEDILNTDLNEFISGKILEEINEYKDTIEELSGISYNRLKEIGELKKEVSKHSLTINLINHIRNEYSKIESDKPDDGGWYNSKQKNQFNYIAKVLETLFNVHKEGGGWHGTRGDGTLKVNLAVNYYKNKDVVVGLLNMITDDNDSIVDFVKHFKMPYDYSKDLVMKYVKSPNYNTNGCIFGISEYWVSAGAGLGNMPHDLIMESEYIYDDDIFEELLNTIETKRSNYHYLYSLPIYNGRISSTQMMKLGECLLTCPTSVMNYDNVRVFVEKKLHSFNKKTLDYLYTLTSDDNQFRLFHWENFPIVYQQKYLMSRSFEEVFKILNNYSCTWTIEEKEKFIKKYSLNKK